METRSDCRYTKDHEWVRLDGSEATIGITDHAQESLGAVVFVELPEEDASLEAGDVLGVIESVKAASEVYSPVSGRVIRVNRELEESPEAINEAPFDQWIAVIDCTSLEEWENLMDESAYLAFCEEETT